MEILNKKYLNSNRVEKQLFPFLSQKHKHVFCEFNGVIFSPKQNKTKHNINFLGKLFLTYRAKRCWLATKNNSDKKDNKTLKRFFLILR